MVPPTFSYLNETLIITYKYQYRIKTTEMKFLRSDQVFSILYKTNNEEIRGGNRNWINNKQNHRM